MKQGIEQLNVAQNGDNVNNYYDLVWTWEHRTKLGGIPTGSRAIIHKIPLGFSTLIPYGTRGFLVVFRKAQVHMDALSLIGLT